MSLNRPEPPSIGDVAQFLAIDRTTLTANIKPLERRGLLKVTVDKQDRRSRRLAATACPRHRSPSPVGSLVMQAILSVTTVRSPPSCCARTSAANEWRR